MKTLVFDEFLDAIGDVKVTLAILIAYVARLEVSVFGQCVGGALGVVQVSLEDIGALDPEFADFTGWDFGFGGGHVFGGLVREEAADGTDVCVPIFPWLGMRRGARFAETVALFDGTFYALVDGFDEFLG